MLSEPEIQDGGGRAMGGIRRGKVRTMYTYVIKKKKKGFYACPQSYSWVGNKREREESGVGLGSRKSKSESRGSLHVVYVYVCKYNKETVRTVSGQEKCGKMKKIVIVG